MKTLEECRKEIDLIDSKIIELYERRMNVVKLVTLYKKENNLPIFDLSREQKMLQKNLDKLSCDEYKKYYEDVLKGFLTASKNMQKDILEEEE